MHNKIDFTSDSIPSLIRQLAVPTSIGFVFNTLFNVVDTYWGGKVSTSALAAMSLTFPVFFILLSMGIGLSTGTTALISNALGANKSDEAEKIGFQALSFSLLNSILLTALGLHFAPYLFRLLGASDQYLGIAVDYMNVYLFGTAFFLVNSILNAMLNSRGDTKTYRNFLVFGFFFNLILDPWFLYGGFGLPPLGVTGIASATITIQICGTIYLFYRTHKNGLFKNFTRNDLIPNRGRYLLLFQQGFPASLNMLTVAIGIFIITYFSGQFGKEAVAAYGIATRIEQIALLPTIGLNIAVLTLSGQNLGANFPDRVYAAWKLGIKYGLWIISIGIVGVFLFAPYLLKIFTNDEKVNAIGVEYLRIAVFFYYAYIFLNISISALQGIKKPLYAVIVGSYRQFLMPVPLFALLAVYLGMGTKGIWWGIFIANWSAAIFTFFYTKKQILKLFNPQPVDSEKR